MDPTDAIAAQLIDGLRAQLPKVGFRLDGIEVQVGALLELDVEGLRQSLLRALGGIEVKLLVEPAMLHCEDCGADYPADEHPCPVCGSGRASLRSGEELSITRAWGETVPTRSV